MKMIQEFKAFAVRGNVVDMAVGIIIGAAFGKIVSSLVSDVVTPPLGQAHRQRAPAQLLEALGLVQLQLEVGLRQRLAHQDVAGVALGL